MNATHIQHGLQDAVAYLQAIPPHTWYTVGLFLSSGIVGSVVIWLVKYWHKVRNLEKPAQHFIGWCLGAIASLGAVADYYLTNSKNFPAFFGSAAPTIFAAATAIHQFCDSKTYKTIVTALKHVIGQKEALKAELTPAPADTPVHASNVAANPTDLFS